MNATYFLVLPSLESIQNFVSTALGSINWPQLIGTGFIAGFGLFLANLLLDKYRRPSLEIKSQASSADIFLDVFNIGDPGLRPEKWDARKLTLKYKVSRIKIENDGRSAAEECKGVLNDGQDKKVCWNVPTERHKMMINSKSFEYLDVCAVLQSEKDSTELVSELKQNIDTIGQTYTNIHNQSTVNEAYAKVKQWITEYDPDYLFPRIIAPTENGWIEPPHLNWHIKPGKSKITISSKNAKPRIINVTIRDSLDDDGRIFDMDPSELDK